MIKWDKKSYYKPRRRISPDINQKKEGSVAPSSSSRAFLTNRTISGSTSAVIKSASEANSENKSPRMVVHGLSISRRKVGLASTVFFIIFILLGLLTFNITVSEEVAINNINSSAKHQDKYQNGIEKYYKQNPIERFRFALDSNQFSRFMQTNFPEIKSISQQGFVSLGKTKFAIELRDPIAVWETSGKKLFVDKQGVSFSDNILNSPSIEVLDRNHFNSVDGKNLTSVRFLRFIGQAISTLKDDHGTKVVRIEIPENTLREIWLYIDNTDFPVKMTIDESAFYQAEDTVKAIKYIADKGIKPQYIDVRSSGKAYYK